MISEENKKIIIEMQAAAWNRVAAQASVVQASTPGESADWAMRSLLMLFDHEKKKIDQAIDRMPDVK